MWRGAATMIPLPDPIDSLFPWSFLTVFSFNIVKPIDFLWISHGFFPVKQGSPAETSATEGCRARRRSSLDLGVREKSQFYGVFFSDGTW